MQIRLLADDSKIPNIAIMKISTYQKELDYVKENLKIKKIKLAMTLEDIEEDNDDR